MIALEAGGGYERVVVGDLAAQGYRLRVLNPAQVRHFARAGGRRAKNDPLDAEMIARYAATFDGPTVIPDQPREALAEAMGSRALPVEHRTAVGNRRHGAVVPQIRETLQAQLAALARQIAALESFITATVAANEDLIRRTERPDRQDFCPSYFHNSPWPCLTRPSTLLPRWHSERIHVDARVEPAHNDFRKVLISSNSFRVRVSVRTLLAMMS